MYVQTFYFRMLTVKEYLCNDESDIVFSSYIYVYIYVCIFFLYLCLYIYFFYICSSYVCVCMEMRDV
jgi:hypothetical protein